MHVAITKVGSEGSAGSLDDPNLQAVGTCLQGVVAYHSEATITDAVRSELDKNFPGQVTENEAPGEGVYKWWWNPMTHRWEEVCCDFLGEFVVSFGKAGSIQVSITSDELV